MDSAKKRVRGIEPPSKAWEAFILPLNHTRKTATKLHASLPTVKQEHSCGTVRGCSRSLVVFRNLIAWPSTPSPRRGGLGRGEDRRVDLPFPLPNPPRRGEGTGTSDSRASFSPSLTCPTKVAGTLRVPSARP